MRIFKKLGSNSSGEEGGPYGRIPAELALALDKRLSFISEDKKGVSVVELVKREGSTLGLIISGGINRGSRAKISNLRPGSVAHRSDALAVGDHLVAVNGIRTARLKHEEIVNLLKNAGDRVTLEVEYEIPDSTESSLCACPKIIQVKLEKENGSFGFTLRGGACPDKLKCRPLVITHVRPGGPADREGTIKSGDRLLAIDGLNLSSATLQEAMEVLKSVDKEAIVSVEYDVSLMDAVRNASGPLLVEIDRAPGMQLGITLTRMPGQRAEGPMVIESIKQASLAERCGALHVGDHILAVDGTRVDHMTPAEAIQILRTAGGSTVKLELLPVSQMVTRRNHDHSGMRVAHLPTSGHGTSGPYNPYNTLSSYGGHSSSSSVCFPSSSGAHPGATSYSQQHSSAPKERPTNYRRIPRFLPAFPSTASLSSSAATAVLSCGQLCHTETTEIILHADQRGFGFTLQGSNFASDLLGSHPVISQIDPGGAADRCGVVQIGDRLISVNGQCTEGLSLTEVVQLIQRSAPRVVLLIEFDVAESVVPSSGTFMVKLARGIAGLGITITSPKNRKSGEPLIISDIKKGSAAHRTGTLQPGDRLLAIDSVRTDHCTIEDAAEILQACESGVVKLRIKKDDTFADPDSSRGAVVFTVELVRHGGPLGITISGTEEPFEPVIISGLTDGGLAEKTGALHVGDHLLAINGCSLRGKPLSEAILLLQNSGDVVTLKIAKFPSPSSAKKDGDEKEAGTKKGNSDAVTDRENNFVSPYVSQPLPSVDSAVESWDSCGLDLLSGHESSKGEDPLTQYNQRDSSSSQGGDASKWSKGESLSPGADSATWDRPLSSPGDKDGKLPQSELWDDSNYISPTSAIHHDTADWTRVLEDLETCGQSQLLRQIEQSIMGSQTSLKSPTPRVSVEFDDVLDRAANQRDDGYQDEEGDDSSCQTTMIYSVNRPRTEEETEEERPPDEVGFYHDPSGTTYGNGPVSIEVYRVTLFKDKVYEDFGFSVSDGLYERGVFVNRIREGGPADQSGILRRYDRILQVNNTRTHAYDCCLTVPLIASAGDCIELVISRPSYCNGVGREGMRPFLRSRNSDDSNQSGVTTHPWMDQSDAEDCSSPIPNNGETSALMTKTL